MASRSHAGLCALSKVFLSTSSRVPGGVSTQFSIPSFLLPSSQTRAFNTSRRSSPSLKVPASHSYPTRLFSTSARDSATVINPVRDEDGNELGLNITERCFKRLAHLASLKKPKTVLRINVLSGGCHGFEYTRELVAESSINLGTDLSADSIDKDINKDSMERLSGGSSGEEAEEEPVLDTVFEAEDGSAAKVVVDQTSLELLKGATVDYTIELMGSEFVVRDIPGASSSCGCGTSFSLKI